MIPIKYKIRSVMNPHDDIIPRVRRDVMDILEKPIQINLYWRLRNCIKEYIDEKEIKHEEEIFNYE